MTSGNPTLRPATVSRSELAAVEREESMAQADACLRNETCQIPMSNSLPPSDWSVIDLVAAYPEDMEPNHWTEPPNNIGLMSFSNA